MVARRSNIAQHSSHHQGPPPGGDGSGHQPNGESQGDRPPGNLKDPRDYVDNGNRNVSTDSGGLNSSNTVITATVTENVTNGASQHGLPENISRVLNSPAIQNIGRAVGNIANAFSGSSSVHRSR